MNSSKPMAWFRMYAEFLHDPKVQMLSESDQRRFIMLMCLRCSNGDVTLHDKEVAFQLRISNDEWTATKVILMEKNLIGDDNKPTQWNKRQFVSDSSTERVARHRESKKQECNVTVTPPETETETETKSKALVAPPENSPIDSPSSPSAPSKLGSRLPDDWKLPKPWGDWALKERPEFSADDIRVEAESFADFWHGKPGKDARKADWLATWRNWIRNSKRNPKHADRPPGSDWREDPRFAGATLL